jgi:hypothetical protein
MKKFLFMLFFAMQIFSCGEGIIEAYPESTKFEIQNDSRVRLLNVKWNGVNFGNIGLGEVLRRDVFDGNGKVFFEARGREYRTYNQVTCEKYKRKKFKFMDATFVEDIEDNAKRITLMDVLNVD